MDGEGNDGVQEVEDIGRVVVFPTPIVGVVLDTTCTIYSNCIPLHYPFNSRLAVYDIIVGSERYVLKRDVTIVQDFRLIGNQFPIVVPDFCKAHFLHCEEIIRLLEQLFSIGESEPCFELFCRHRWLCCSS